MPEVTPVIIPFGAVGAIIGHVVLGMNLTTKYVADAGLVQAGVGQSLAEAREARFLETPKGRVALIYLESPANPTNALVDVEAVRQVRDAAFPENPPPIAIDNTFLGPLWQQPLRHGADLSVYSLTKYAGGHSDLVAGGVVGSKALINPIRMMRNTIGTITDPNTAWMLLRSLETLELRIARHPSETAARHRSTSNARCPIAARIAASSFAETSSRARSLRRWVSITRARPSQERTSLPHATRRPREGSRRDRRFSGKSH